MLKTITDFQEGADIGGQPTEPAHMLRWEVQRVLEQMERFRKHIHLTERLNNCLRLREGQYDELQLRMIAEFGGSSVFARLTTNKIRGGAAMLRSIFIQGERPWDIDATPVPSLPEDIAQNVEQLVTVEAQTLQQSGQPIQPEQLRGRIEQLTRAAGEAARKQARMEAIESARYIDDILVEGNFYESLNAFILDFCTYPFAVMAGPTAVMKTMVDYVEGKPTRTRKPVLMFRRVDPYDIMWGPGAMDFANAEIIERMRMTRADVNALIGLDGFDEQAIRSVLRDYGESGYSYWQFFEQIHEDAQNQGSRFYQMMIEVLLYTGTMPGWQLQDFGIPVPEGETLRRDYDYQVQAWICGEYTLKVQVDPDPSNRPPYYSAAYEPVSGSIPGTALPELIGDVQETYNATLRALVNNVGISSGPQVGINRDRWQAPNDQTVHITPWQIWEFDSDPSAPAGEKPIEFYQPQINAQELMGVLSYLQNMADEISGIPRYLTGSDKLGGAGRTASGLSQLMSNANRTMTSVAGGIDQNVIEPILRKTYDLVLLTTGTDVLRGDESIVARGATYAEERETDRMRMIEFLQATANPFDMQILGMNGRATLLRSVSEAFLKGNQTVVPSEDTMMQMEEAQKQAAQMQQAAGAAQPQGQPNQPAPREQKDERNQTAQGSDNAMRTRSKGAIARTARQAA